MRQLRVRVGVLVACGVLGAGCTSGEADGAASPSASAPASTSPLATETVTETEVATPSASAEPSAEPSASASGEARVVLDEGGLGIASFGDTPEDVIAALDGRYGSPTEDSGWVGPGSFGVCPGTETRGVRYGQLLVRMSDGPTDYGPAGRRHLFSYVVRAQNPEDPAAEYGDGPQTAGGIGVGSTVADLRAAFGDGLEIREGEEAYGPNFVLTSEGTVQEFPFRGSLTDTTDAGLVTTIGAGQGCGE